MRQDQAYLRSKDRRLLLGDTVDVATTQYKLPPIHQNNLVKVGKEQ